MLIFICAWCVNCQEDRFDSLCRKRSSIRQKWCMYPLFLRLIALVVAFPMTIRSEHNHNYGCGVNTNIILYVNASGCFNSV